jgi:environmental stress-induced protein Ves
VGELIEFDGAIAAHCELLDGPCVDLNVMILKSGRASVRVEHVIEALEVNAAPDETVLVFPISGAMTLAVANGHSVTLEPWDLAVASNGAAHLRRAESANSAPIAVFVAALKLVSG